MGTSGATIPTSPGKRRIKLRNWRMTQVLESPSRQGLESSFRDRGIGRLPKNQKLLTAEGAENSLRSRRKAFNRKGRREFAKLAETRSQNPHPLAKIARRMGHPG